MARILDKAKDMFGGVPGIYNDTEPPPQVTDEEINTPDQQMLYEMADYDYQRFKEKRQPIEEVWRKEQNMWKGNQWAGLRPADNGPYPERMEYVGNYARSQLESIISRLTGWMPVPDFEPQEPGDTEDAATLNVFIPHELTQINFKQKHIRAVRRMVIHGPLIYEVDYDPTVEGGRGYNKWDGQNDILPVQFGSFFPDPSVKDFIYLQKGRAHILNYLMTLDYVRERWPKQGPKVMADNRSDETEIFDVDSISSIGTTLSTEDNQTTVNVLRYMYKGKPKYMSDEDIKQFREKAEMKLAEGKDPSVCIAQSKGTMKGIHFLYVTTNGVFLSHESYVYDHGQYPIVARTMFPEEDNPWGAGYMRDLMSPQTMYNRFCELAIDVTSKMGAAGVIYGTAAGLNPGTEGAPNAFQQIWRRMRAKAGAMLPVADVTQVKEMQGVPPNPGIYQYIQHFLDMMQKIPGAYDTASGAANPNVTSGRQSEALIAAAQGRLSTAAELIEEALQEVFGQYIELCAQFYTTERIARITGKTVSFSRDSIVRTSPVEYEQPTMNPETGMEENQPVTLQEEYVPCYDIKVSIGVERPRDREYYIQTAMTLFGTMNPLTGMPMIDAQAVRYTVDNGRMEPMSTIEERMKTEEQIMQNMQQLQQQNEMLTKQVEQQGQELQKVDQAKMASAAQKQQFDEQKAVNDQELEWAKLEQQKNENIASTALRVGEMRSPVSNR